jgi:glycosyltransferase involved in cell wall biosynthesis
MKKVAYLIVQEDLAGPIIQSQVINVLKAMPKEARNRLALVCFYRIDYYLRSNDNNKLRVRLRSEGIDTIFMPFLSWKFPISLFLLPLVIPQLLIGLIYIVMRRHIEVLHCRSYNAGLLGAIMKTFINIKVIFDPRSPYPEENIAAGKWNKRSINYEFWKKAENWIAKKSDVIIAISQPFLDSFQRISPDTRMELIPNNYFDYTNNDIDKNESTNDTEQSNSITLCYIGSLGQWNDPEIYMCFLKRVMAETLLPMRAKFLVLPDSMKILEKAILASELDEKLFEIKFVPPENVQSEISSCTLGLQLMKYEDDRLSIKFVEYLAAGLPVIVSGNVKGAAHIVKTNDVGFVIDPNLNNLSDLIDFIGQVAENKTYWRKRCQSVAENLFSTDSVSKKLFKLYE